MGNLSENFDREEFRCNCGCGKVVVSVRLVMALQSLRDRVKSPIHITSGYRCTEHNRKVGGVRNSRHLSGEAADIVIEGMGPREMYSHALAIQEFRNGGIGIYVDRGFVHVDIRDKAARWAEIGGRKVSYFDYAKWEEKKNGKVFQS